VRFLVTAKHRVPGASSSKSRAHGLRVCVAALILGAGQTAAAQQAASLPASLEKLFAEGVQAQKAGQLDVAEKDFLEVLRQGGKVSFVHNNLGIVYQMQGEHTRAVEQFREAARLQPDYVAPRILMGASLLAMGRVAEATRELQLAVKLQPQEPLARLQLARAYARAENFPARAEQLRALRKLAPQEPEYAYQLGDAYMKLAGWCAQEMDRINPRSARVYQMLGEEFRVQPGRIERAIREFQRAARADPKLPGIHQALAEIYLEQGKIADAQGEIEKELAVVPESVAALAVKQKLQGGKPVSQ